MNVCGNDYVEVTVSLPEDKNLGSKPRPVRSAETGNEGSTHFCFGTRRYTSTGPRRLFVAQTSAVPPIVAPELARPQTILRPGPDAGAP